MDYRWKCSSCGKYFNPLQENGDFSFNCPHCGSGYTVPSNKEKTDTEESESDPR